MVRYKNEPKFISNQGNKSEILTTQSLCIAQVSPCIGTIAPYYSVLTGER